MGNISRPGSLPFDVVGAPRPGKYVQPVGEYTGGVSPVFASSYSGKILLCRAVIGAVVSISALSFKVDTLVAAKLGRVGIYADVNGLPGSLLYDAGAASLATAGIKDVALSVVLPSGAYWLAYLSDATVTASVSGLAASAAACVLGAVPDAFGVPSAGYEGIQAYGALPSVLPALTPIPLAVAIFLKAAL